MASVSIALTPEQWVAWHVLNEWMDTTAPHRLAAAWMDGPWPPRGVPRRVPANVADRIRVTAFEPKWAAYWIRVLTPLIQAETPEVAMAVQAFPDNPNRWALAATEAVGRGAPFARVFWLLSTLDDGAGAIAWLDTRLPNGRTVEEHLRNVAKDVEGQWRQWLSTHRPRLPKAEADSEMATQRAAALEAERAALARQIAAKEAEIDALKAAARQAQGAVDVTSELSAVRGKTVLVISDRLRDKARAADLRGLLKAWGLRARIVRDIDKRLSRSQPDAVVVESSAVSHKAQEWAKTLGVPVLLVPALRPDDLRRALGQWSRACAAAS